MSDAANYETALDPDRPWITDERQLPANMNWLSTLLNPTGKSPKLHFTRAWTLLFMMQLTCVAALPLTLGIISLTGADISGASLFNLYLTAVVFVVTTLFSFVIHCRRLNDASKMNIPAFVVLIPLIIASAMFVMQVQGKAAEYDDLYAERAVYLADPDAWEERQREERRKAQEEARTERQAFLLPLRLADLMFNLKVSNDFDATSLFMSELAQYQADPTVWRARQEQERREIYDARQAADAAGEASGERRRGGERRGGGQGGWDQRPTADKELPSQEEFILRPNVGVFQQIIMPISGLIMIWSLLWVARVPYFGKEERDEADFSTA